MGERDQDAAIGRMVNRYSELKKRRAALMSEAREMAQLLERAGRVLHDLEFYHEFHGGQKDGYARRNEAAAVPEYPGAERPRALVAELRTVVGELRCVAVCVNTLAEERDRAAAAGEGRSKSLAADGSETALADDA